MAAVGRIQNYNWIVACRNSVIITITTTRDGIWSKVLVFFHYRERQRAARTEIAGVLTLEADTKHVVKEIDGFFVRVQRNGL